jgi:hypothetical protein
MPVIAGRNVNNNDLGVMAGGAALLIFSFFTWFKVDAGAILGVTFTKSGWTSGLFSFLAVLLGVAAAVLLALRIFANVQLPRLQWGWSFIVLAATGVATLLILFKLLFGYHSWERGVGLYLSFLASLVESAFAFLAFKLSGETLPGGRRI